MAWAARSSGIVDLRLRRTRKDAVPKAKGSGPKDGLLGFTGSTVTVRFGSIIYTYGERGKTVYSKAA